MFPASEIARLISILPTTKATAINAPDLATILGYSAAPNQEELRALIRQAIDSGELVGSSKTGYWLINSKTELEEVINSLEQRAQGVCDRRNNLLSSWNSKNPRNVSSLPNMDVKI